MKHMTTPLFDYERVDIPDIQTILKQNYYLFGLISGLTSMNDNKKIANSLLIKQELATYFEVLGNKLSVKEIYGKEQPRDFRDKYAIYEVIQQLQGKNPYSDMIDGRKMSCMPPHDFKAFQEVLLDWKSCAESVSLSDVFLESGVICFRVLTGFTEKEESKLWASIIINMFFREKGLLPDIYIPFAWGLWNNGFHEKKGDETKQSMSADRWMRYYLNIIQKSLKKTQTLLVLLTEQEHTIQGLATQKKEKVYARLAAYIKEIPVFSIQDLTDSLSVSYNTAAKVVAILQKENQVVELSNKQRYRVYCYKAYLPHLNTGVSGYPIS